MLMNTRSVEQHSVACVLTRRNTGRGNDEHTHATHALICDFIGKLFTYVKSVTVEAWQ